MPWQSTRITRNYHALHGITSPGRVVGLLGDMLSGIKAAWARVFQFLVADSVSLCFT
jgi:hypothetical protein